MKQQYNSLYKNDDPLLNKVQAKTIKFNKNFFNFEDPEVLYSFMDPKQKSIWKKTYGYDYVNMEHSLENP